MPMETCVYGPTTQNRRKSSDDQMHWAGADTCLSAQKCFSTGARNAIYAEYDGQELGVNPLSRSAPAAMTRVDPTPSLVCTFPLGVRGRQTRCSIYSGPPATLVYVFGPSDRQKPGITRSERITTERFCNRFCSTEIHIFSRWSPYSIIPIYIPIYI